MLPIEIVRKIMLYNIHPLAVVMKYYIIEHEECELAYLQEEGEPLNQSFIAYMEGEILRQDCMPRKCLWRIIKDRLKSILS